MKNKYLSKNNIIPILKTIFGNDLKIFKKGMTLKENDIVYDNEYVYKCKKAGAYNVLSDDMISPLGLRHSLPVELPPVASDSGVYIPDMYDLDEKHYKDIFDTYHTPDGESNGDSALRTQYSLFSRYFKMDVHDTYSRNKYIFYKLKSSEDGGVSVYRRLFFDKIRSYAVVSNGYRYEGGRNINPMFPVSKHDLDPVLICYPMLSLGFRGEGKYHVKMNVIFDAEYIRPNQKYVDTASISVYHTQEGGTTEIHNATVSSDSSKFSLLPIEFDVTVGKTYAYFSEWSLDIAGVSLGHDPGFTMGVLNNYLNCNDPALKGKPQMKPLKNDYTIYDCSYAKERSGAYSFHNQIEDERMGIIPKYYVPTTRVFGENVVTLSNMQIVHVRGMRLFTFVGPITIERIK